MTNQSSHLAHGAECGQKQQFIALGEGGWGGRHERIEERSLPNSFIKIFKD